MNLKLEGNQCLLKIASPSEKWHIVLIIAEILAFQKLEQLFCDCADSKKYVFLLNIHSSWQLHHVRIFLNLLDHASAKRKIHSSLLEFDVKSLENGRGRFLFKKFGKKQIKSTFDCGIDGQEHFGDFKLFLLADYWKIVLMFIFSNLFCLAV